jgi:polyhydroxyalkanoate synthesis regulator phasin
MSIKKNHSKSKRGATALRMSVLLSALLAVPMVAQAEKNESLEELRNTVINLLEGLVQKGVLTREQAQAMVQDAQEKATAQAAAKEKLAEAEKDAVRVTYVPEIVRKQISEQVRGELRPEITKEVVAQAKQEKWGIPGALPDWIGRIQFSGDIRLRGQSDMYANDNDAASCGSRCYFDYLTINARGGKIRAGESQWLNTTEDRLRERLRLRMAMDAKIADGISARMRLSTGNTTDPVSTNQTLGQTGARYTVVLDQAYLHYAAGRGAVPWFELSGGRIANPFVSTDLVWDSDLSFEGLATTFRLPFNKSASNAFVVLGAFPLQEVELSTNDKWLYAGQMGLDWEWGSGAAKPRITFAAAYYYYDNIKGVRNALATDGLTDFTAPRWMQKGNTLFDIRNNVDTTLNLYALAADYHLANATAALEIPVSNYKLMFTADYVTNLGYDEDAVRELPTLENDGEKRVNGYQVELGFGTKDVSKRGNWRAYAQYRYVERDAVLDAFTDSDFHLGGTDARGYVLRGEWWFRNRSSVGLRYLSADSIDGLPFGIDTLMLDFNGAF